MNDTATKAPEFAVACEHCAMTLAPDWLNGAEPTHLDTGDPCCAVDWFLPGTDDEWPVATVPPEALSMLGRVRWAGTLPPVPTARERLDAFRAAAGRAALTEDTNGG